MKKLLIFAASFAAGYGLFLVYAFMKLTENNKERYGS